MSPNEIEAHLRQRPFVPFRLHLSDQAHYDIRHPEMLMVTRRVVCVAIYDSADPDMPERAVFCDSLHVTRLELLDGKRAEAAP